MALGEFRPPSQVDKDEDKYGKGKLSFTKIQILYAAIGFLVGALVFLFLSMFKLTILNILGAVIIVINVLFGVFIGSAIIPENKYLSGAGLRYDMYIKRLIMRKFDKSKHNLYTNNINRDKIVSYKSDINAGRSFLNILIDKIDNKINKEDEVAEDDK